MIGTGDTVETHHTVQCPRRGLATAFERCCGCMHMKSIDVDEDGKHGTVECLVANDGALPRGRVDVAEAAVREHLTDLVGFDTTCVRGDVRIDTIDDLLTGSKLRALPVSDETRNYFAGRLALGD